MKKITIFDIADYIVHKFQSKINNITPLKLQKLLYYVKVWSLIANKELINEEFYKWEYGPVNINIYQKYKHFNSNSIPKPEFVIDFPNTIKELINFIVENYIELDAITLSQLTHSEEPWQKTKHNKPINEYLIKSYYSKLPFARNFPLKKDKPYFPILTPMDHSFTFDFSKNDLNLLNQKYYFKNYEDYKKQKEKIKNELKVIFG
ncbi:Panacea domain-containing protein [Calditrichota bacterium LG25]